MKDKKKRYSELICNFLKTHDCISISTLEQKCEMPPTTLQKAMSGDRLIPEKFLYTLVYVLANYGLELDYDWKITCVEHGNIFMRKFVRNVKTKEIKEPDGSHFVYVLEEYRSMVEDFHELP